MTPFALVNRLIQCISDDKFTVLCFCVYSLLRTGIRNTPQLPSGSSEVVNGFTLSALGLRMFDELIALRSSDSSDLASLSTTAH